MVAFRFPIPDSRFPKAGNGTRTRDPNLGKVVLYQLSYSRDTCLPLRTFQSASLTHSSPNVEPGMEARGIEPLTSAVRLQRSPN